MDYITENKGHVWKLNENGYIDIFALSYDFHNGPACVVCGYTFCHHCEPIPKYSCAEYLGIKED